MSYDRDLSFIFNSPTKIIFGENSVKDIGLEIDSLGCTKALLVTDKGVTEAGLAERVKQALGRRYAGTYDKCIQDSGFHLVNEGAAFAIEQGADVLVSVGGGSVIDTAKGMAIVMKEGGQLQDYSGIQVLSRPQTPHLVVPTTAGTGSEATWVAVIKDCDQNVKELFCDYFIIPNIAVLDPTMTADLPPHLTASTGMDALTHAVEAIHALQREPIADAMALHAIRMIVQYLPRCVEQGNDLVSRGQQQLAATMAGIAFGNAQIGMVHAMAHSIGALFKVPHGLGNSILLPYVMLFNLEECADRYALIAQAMGLDIRGLTEIEAGKAAAEAIWELTKNIGLPQKLREAGVPAEGLTEAADLSLSDGAILYNPRMVTEAEEVLQVYREAW
ncbi:MAG TPA: iron-containing alcohol dehydrogenase [Candidatus Limnocylindrales bacterium]|nr:iron-containing alcohol dehydrogenase [Candidatus Limnocylindrales bacterium]